MKAKSRKRLLISSVAMLLVAMLALGTATFAWFTTDNETYADKISVKTNKTSVLKLADNTVTSASSDGWTSVLHYNNTNKTLMPASSLLGINWFHADAASQDNSAAKDNKATAINFSGNDKDVDDYMFYNQLNILNAGASAVENITIKFTLAEAEQTTGKNYLRLALVPSTALGATGAVADTAKFKANSYTPDATTGKYQGGIFSYGADSAKPVESINAETSVITANDTVTTIDASSEITIDAGSLDVNATKSYMLIIWFEGQDEDCKDTYAGNYLSDIKFEVEGTPVA